MNANKDELPLDSTVDDILDRMSGTIWLLLIRKAEDKFLRG